MNDMFQEVWQRQITANLEPEFWSSSYLYNSAAYFELPLNYAFSSGNETYKQEFTTHFQLFNSVGFTENIGWLANVQYGHFVSKFVVLNADVQGRTALTDDLYEKLYDLIYNEWSTNEVADWSNYQFVGREAAIIHKLETGERPITDADLFLLAIASDLISYNVMMGEAVPAALFDMQSMASRVIEEVGHFRADGGWVFDPNGWASHPDYAMANWSGEGDIPLANYPPDISWDISHASRFPAWLNSFSSAQTAIDSSVAVFDEALTGLKTQLKNKVLTQAPADDGVWLTSNYLDGSNGVFRFGYQSFFPNDGYQPHGLSGTYLLGTWSQLNDIAITNTYKDAFNAPTFSPAELEIFNEPVRRTGTTSDFSWTSIVESGDIRLWLGIAAKQYDLPQLPSIDKPTLNRFEVVVNGEINGQIIFDGLPLLATDVLEIVDTGDANHSGNLRVRDNFLIPGVIHNVPAADLSDLTYVAGNSAGGDRFYWRLGRQEDSLWSSVELVRSNSDGVITSSTIVGQENNIFDLSDVVTYDDPDNDQPQFYQLWSNSSSDSFVVEGVAIPNQKNVTVTHAQFNSTEFILQKNVDYYVRANDGGSWSAWYKLPVQIQDYTNGNSAPLVDIADTNVAPLQWVRLNAVLNYSDQDGDVINKVQVWDDVGSNSWWADGAIVYAAAGYTTFDMTGVWFRGDSSESSQTLWARAHDGQQWSRWDSFKLNTFSNAKPVIDISDQALNAGEARRLTEIMDYYDSDDDVLVKVQLWDSDGENNWYLNADALNASSGVIVEQIEEIWLRDQGELNEQILWVRPHDGFHWGNWVTFDLF